MRVDFIKQETTLEATLSFRQAGILQEALQAQYLAVVSDPSTSNTVEVVEELEGLAAIVGIDLDTSCEAAEQKSI